MRTFIALILLVSVACIAASPGKKKQTKYNFGILEY